MLHQIMVVLHATAATASFAFGALAEFPRLPHRSKLNLFDYYFIALIGFLAGAIVAHLRQLDGVQRALFAGLFLLSLYMLFRGFQARAALRSQRRLHHFGGHRPWGTRLADGRGGRLGRYRWRQDAAQT